MTFSQVLLFHISLCYLGSTHHTHMKPLVKAEKFATNTEGKLEARFDSQAKRKC